MDIARPVQTNAAAPSLSLYQQTLSLIERLHRLGAPFERFLFPAGIAAATTTDASGGVAVITDPIQLLFDCFRLGAPLCALVNLMRPRRSLDVPDVANIVPGAYTNVCKRCVYHFLVAVKDELALTDAQLFAVSDLYKDDTDGLVKAIRSIAAVVDAIEARGYFPPPRPVPFQTVQQLAIHAPTDNRARVIAELLQTERSYTISMQELLSYQQELLNSNDVSKDAVYKIFSNLPELVDFQRRFLVAMESTLALPSAEQRIGALFANHKEGFEVYRQFCGNYNIACQLAIQEVDALSKFPRIDPTRGLQGYLIKPIQRICKYPLLLNELIKLSSPETYPYYHELLEGLEAIKLVTEHVNETKRIEDNRTIRQEMIERVEDWKGIRPEELGDLLLSDKFTMLTNEGEKEYLLFLFERLLLCVKENRKKKKRGAGEELVYSIKGNIFMTSVTAVEDVSKPSNQFFEILVHWRDISETDTFNLRCRNQELVNLWKDRMDRLIRANQQRRKSHSASRSQDRPGLGNNTNQQNSNGTHPQASSHLQQLQQQIHQRFQSQPTAQPTPSSPITHAKSHSDVPDASLMKRAQSIGASLADIGLLDNKPIGYKSTPVTSRAAEQRIAEIMPRSSSITPSGQSSNENLPDTATASENRGMVPPGRMPSNPSISQSSMQLKGSATSLNSSEHLNLPIQPVPLPGMTVGNHSRKSSTSSTSQPMSAFPNAFSSNSSKDLPPVPKSPKESNTHFTSSFSSMGISNQASSSQTGMNLLMNFTSKLERKKSEKKEANSRSQYQQGSGLQPSTSNSRLPDLANMPVQPPSTTTTSASSASASHLIRGNSQTQLNQHIPSPPMSTPGSPGSNTNASTVTDTGRPGRSTRSGSVSNTRLQTDLRSMPPSMPIPSLPGGPPPTMAMPPLPIHAGALPPPPMIFLPNPLGPPPSMPLPSAPMPQTSHQQHQYHQQQQQYQQLKNATSQYNRSSSESDSVHNGRTNHPMQNQHPTASPLQYGMPYHQAPNSAPPRPPPSSMLPPVPTDISQLADDLLMTLDAASGAASGASHQQHSATSPLSGSLPSAGPPGTATAPRSSPLIKIKAHYNNDVIIIAVPSRGTTHRDLITKITRKLRLNNTPLPDGRDIFLQYRNEVGDFIDLGCDEDVGVAFELARSGPDRGFVHIQAH